VAKKESAAGGMFRSVGSAIGATIGGTLREVLLDVTTQVHESAEALLLKIEERTITLQKRFLNALASFLFLSLAVLFLVLGAYFYLTDQVGVPKAYVFFGLGIILLIAGLIYKAQSSK
jgi:hypothetical protein